MMRLSMHTWMRVKPLDISIARLARYGYDAIQIGGEPGKHDLREVRALLAQRRIACCSSVTLMKQGRDLISPDPAVRRRTVEYINACATMVHELGGGFVCVVPGTVGKIVPQADAESEWRWAVEGLSRCAEWAERHGVKLGIGPINRFETYFLNRCDQALALADAVGSPHVGVILDAFHLNIEEADLLGAIREAGDRLLDFHVADNNRRPPGEGSLDWGAILGAPRGIGYTGYLSSEFVLPMDRTPHGAVSNGAPIAMTPSDDEYLRVHASGDVAADTFDRCVEGTIRYLRRVMSSP
jgi:D-psicose/D-tagatose/L-ribulose 3-epimerase